MSGETLYEVDPPSPFVWQPAALLADGLDVSDRTIRTWASKETEIDLPGGYGKGRVCRIRVSNKAFYRLEVLKAEAVGDPDPVEAAGSLPNVAPPPEMVELALAWREETSSLRDRLLEASLEAERAKAEAMEAELLAEVATRDVERFRAELAKAEALIATREFHTRLLARAASLPWYAFRRRRELLAAVDRPLLEGSA